MAAPKQIELKLSPVPRVLNKYRDRIPEDAVNIMRPGKWGNPFSHFPHTRAAHRVKTREEAVLAHRLWFLTSDDEQAVELRRIAKLPPSEGGLRGADVICCCFPLPCHGRVLLEWSNSHITLPKELA